MRAAERASAETSIGNAVILFLGWTRAGLAKQKQTPRGVSTIIWAKRYFAVLPGGSWVEQLRLLDPVSYLSEDVFLLSFL